MNFAPLVSHSRLDLAIFALVARHFPTIFAKVARHFRLDYVIFATVARQFRFIFMVLNLPLSEHVIFGPARNFCFDSCYFCASS